MSRHFAWLALASLCATTPASAQTTADDAIANARILNSLDPCARSGVDDEVIVCGRRLDPDRYRVPGTPETDPFAGGRRVAGEALRPTTDLSHGDCGIFAGQRRCSKAEMALYGYGGGRDPLTFATRLFTALTNPAATAPPPPLP